MSRISADFPSAELLINAGYTTHLKIQKASDEDLLSIEHIGPAALEKIRAAQNGEEPVTVEHVVEQFACKSPLCGHLISAYPCAYCGHVA